MMEIHASDSLSSYNHVATKPRQTRDCTDPWKFMQILSNNDIRPCCFSEVIIGSVRKDKGGIEGALNSEAAVELRKSLLTGNLDKYCAICSYRPMTNVDAFQRKIEKLVHPGKDLKTYVRKLLPLDSYDLRKIKRLLRPLLSYAY